MPLSDTAIRNAKPKTKQYKLTDEKGMYLLVNSSGKYFRLDYRFQGKRKTMALGVYPEMALKEARIRRDEARKLLQNDIDPMAHRKEIKAVKIEQTENNFESIALEWFSKNKASWKPGHSRTIIQRLKNNVFPWLGNMPIAEITASDLLLILRRIEERGAIETAHRIKQISSQIFRYAIATGRADRDPSADLRGALPPTNPKHMAAIIEPKKAGGLLRAIEGYEGHIVTKSALALAPLVFVRPGELRQAEWSEVTLEMAEWRIPAEKMKKKLPHIVPLSFQAIAILQNLQPFTGDGQYVFPSPRSSARPMSNNALLAALRRMGYSKEEMSVHGFRTMASTLLHELSWPSDIIERQLAHIERNSVKAAYNHAQHLPERRKMMQAWADYLDTLKSADKITSFNKADHV